MFENSLRLVEECELTWLHVFPYSARPGTPAARMPQVAGAAIRERAARLRSAGATRVEAHHAAMQGRICAAPDGTAGSRADRGVRANAAIGQFGPGNGCARRGLRGRRKECCWRRLVEAALSGYRRGRRSPSDRGSGGGGEVEAGGGVEAVQPLLVESERDRLVDGEARGGRGRVALKSASPALSVTICSTPWFSTWCTRACAALGAADADVLGADADRHRPGVAARAARWPAGSSGTSPGRRAAAAGRPRRRPGSRFIAGEPTKVATKVSRGAL